MTEFIEFMDIRPVDPAIRLGDLYEVARRIRRLGISEVDVSPGTRGVEFWDHRIKACVVLGIEPWFDGRPGWIWRQYIGLPNGFMSGPMGLNGYILASPLPREVVRAYQAETRMERRSPPRKKERRRS